MIVKQLFQVKDSDKMYVEVELDYSVGGFNYFTGKTDGRGYYMYVRPAEKTERGGMMYSLMEGFKLVVKEVGRKSKKAETEAILRYNELAESKAKEYASTRGWDLI